MNKSWRGSLTIIRTWLVDSKGLSAVPTMLYTLKRRAGELLLRDTPGSPTARRKASDVVFFATALVIFVGKRAYKSRSCLGMPP